MIPIYDRNIQLRIQEHCRILQTRHFISIQNLVSIHVIETMKPDVSPRCMAQLFSHYNIRGLLSSPDINALWLLLSQLSMTKKENLENFRTSRNTILLKLIERICCSRRNVLMKSQALFVHLCFCNIAIEVLLNAVGTGEQKRQECLR